MDRLTPFPSFVEDDVDDSTLTNTVQWEVHGPVLPLDVYVISWADLLCSFTSDDTPVFFLNGEPVKADVSTQTYQPAVLDADAGASRHYTSLTFGADTPNTSQLGTKSTDSGRISWHLDSQTGRGTLTSSKNVDPSFLRQIAHQLKLVVQKHAHTSGLTVTIPETASPTLSLAHPQPSVLPGLQLLHELALSHRSSTNHAIEFLEHDGSVGTLSYGALDEISTSLAIRIVTALNSAIRHPKARLVVPVLLPQSLDLYVAYLAILKAGAAFCPLNLDTPPERIQFIVEDVDATVVVTRQALRERFAEKDGLNIILVDGTDGGQADPGFLSASCSPSDLAYIMYTSGSTGRPKGVGISHLAVTQSLLAHEHLIPPIGRFLQFASPTFDVSVFEIFFPLMRGVTLVGCDRELMLRDISHVMQTMRIDAAELTPTVAGELLRTRAAAPSLRVLLTIGEMLTRRVVDEFGRSAAADGILQGMYGPTEAAIHCTAAMNFPATSRVNMIGRPFETVSAFICSLQAGKCTAVDQFEVLPIGQIGELVLGGPQVAEGYINRPEENAKAFLQHPKYGRLYRTGDKARMLPNGELECFGRIASGQVKLRGQRIELGEIESIICAVPGVDAAAAIVADGTLVAFLKTNDKQRLSSETIRQACRRWLPRFMVPGEIILLEKFPQLSSGKIDRKKLEYEYLHQNSSALQQPREVFRDSVEEAIFRSVQTVTGGSVPVYDSLEAAGLDSLKAIRLASELRRHRVNVGVGQILEADTIRNLWLFVTQLEESPRRTEVDDAVCSIREVIVRAGWDKLQPTSYCAAAESVQPCTDIQLSMLTESFRDLNSYCNRIELEFSPSIHPASFIKAFRGVAEQNDILRSGFIETGLGDNPYARVIWKTLKDDVFQHSESFDGTEGNIDDLGILNPLRIRYKVESGALQTCIRIHHALYDGWSWELILLDVHTFLMGNAPPSRPSYNDVTQFLMAFNMSPSSKESQSYWQQTLERITPSTLPNFSTRTDINRELACVSYRLRVSPQKLEEAARRLHISRRILFEAAFGFLLALYSGTEDVLFGTVFSGRTLPLHGIESVIGPCIRTLPTRIQIDKMQTVNDLLLALHNMNKRSQEYGNLSLSDIKKASGVDVDRNLFDCAIVWQETIWSDFQDKEKLFKTVASADFSEFALMLELEPKINGIHVRMTHDISVMPPRQAELFLAQLDSITEILMDSVNLPLNQIIRHLPDAVLSIENPNYVTSPSLDTLAAGVEKFAVVDPNRTAIEFITAQDPSTGALTIDSITYGLLNKRANRLAHHLVQIGVKMDDYVGIVMEKSIELYVAILGAIKAGAGYVPMTVQTPQQRIQTILQDTKASVCIMDGEAEFEFSAITSLKVVDLRQIPWEDLPDENLNLVNKGSDLAYAVFTSGSTGTPKGVLITRHNLQSNITVLAELYPMSCKSKILQACSHAFDVSVFEIFFAWHTGMTLCSATNDIMFRDIEDVIRSMHITHLSLTPTVAALIHPDNVPEVEFLVTAGEGLTSKVHRDWAGRSLYQGYGPSEVTNICTVRPRVESWHPIRNIGYPFKNTSAFVLSEDDDIYPVPRGAVGELCFGGGQVGRGYLNQPDLTAKKFIEIPQYGRLYRSGDFGRLLPDGSLVFIGRKDDQVKLRGQRIELDEINSILLRQSSVRDCASTILDSNPRGQQRLLTFFVPSDDTEDIQFLIQKLFETLSAALPIYMIPSFLIPVKIIPMTSNKKTDHRSLQIHFREVGATDRDKYSRDQKDANGDQELSETERRVARVISELTGVPLDEIGRHTSFYTLGLDSISTISLSRRLKDGGLGHLDVSTILRHSSVARLGAVISAKVNEEQQQHVSTPPTTSTFDTEGIERMSSEFWERGISIQAVRPCTPLQEAMLSFHSPEEDSAYFNHLLFEVQGFSHRLKDAWEILVQRHEIFRTYFRATNEPRFPFAQVVAERILLPWLEINTTTADLDYCILRQKKAFETWSPENAGLPYALSYIRGPSGQKHHLLFSIHHALHDGEAIAQALRDVEFLVTHHPLSEVVPFGNFIEAMLAVDASTSDRFWDQYLDRASPTLLFTGLCTESLPDRSALQKHVCLDMPLDRFRSECKELSVSPLNVFHAAWSRLLSLYSGTPDVCFGNVFSGRTIPLDGVDRIIGPCFNTLPVRIAASPTATNADILNLAQKSNRDILPHQLSSPRRVQKRATQDGSRLFDTLIILQNGSLELNPRIWKLVSEEGNMDFPAICEIAPDEKRNQIRICFHFQKRFVSEADADIIGRHYIALLEHTIRYPSAQALDKRIIGGEIPAVIEHTQKRIETTKPSSQSRNNSTDGAWTNEELEVYRLLRQFVGNGRQLDLSPNTTIFQLGLDSINAVQISAAMRKLNHRISAGDILEAASIRNIATLLQSNSNNVVGDVSFDFAAFQLRHLRPVLETLGLSEEVIQSIRPCTPVQNGMLAMFTNNNGGMYLNRITWRLPEPIAHSKMRDAWKQVMSRHEMLRTGFVSLKEQDYPFAMLTYREGAVDLPWYEDLNTENSGFSSPSVSDMLAHLHQPPWFVSVDARETVTTLQFAAHHAIYDAQSLHRIVEDVVSVLNGGHLRDNAPIEATLGPILSASVRHVDQSRAFWEEAGKEIQHTKFPDLHPYRENTDELLVSAVPCSMSQESLEYACQQSGVSLQAAGQTAWARLLAAYTGEKNVTFGVVFSGRNLSEAAQEAVFPCLVTVPFSTRLEGTNRELVLKTVRRNALLMKNQFTPLSKIQRWLKSDEGLFDTLFVYQKFSSGNAKPGGWEVIEEDAKIDYPVSMELVPLANELELRLTHQCDLVPAEQAIQMLRQFDALLIDSLVSPASPADSYTCVEKTLLAITPARELRIPTSVTLLHDYVEANAQKHPDKLAFEFAFDITPENIDKKSWTYRELNEDGNKVAHLLEKSGVRPRELIAICFNKCPEASLAILGILKAGCAYVAIDPNAPVARKEFIVEDAAAKVVMCTQSTKAGLDSIPGLKIVEMDTPGLLNCMPACKSTLHASIRPDDTCYCLYTSGTTGTPKGCEITHDNAVQAMLAFQRLFAGHWDTDSKWLQFASFHFDVSVLEQYWSWSVGICVTSCPRDLLFEDLPGTIRRLQITHIDLTPSLARLVQPEDVPSLCKGVFITGGEQLKQEILDAWGKQGVIYNGYGPTEVTIGCTMLPRVPANGKPSNIGPQFDNVGSYVFVPGTNTPVLRGAIGELCVSGPLVGRGYLRRPELTREKFQFLEAFGERIYRTGDLVRILHDGSFQFLGRIDDQVKLRGQRLEIGEINETIRSASPEVGEVATLVAKHSNQSKEQLVSFVTRKTARAKRVSVEVDYSEENRAFLSAIQKTCHARLPGYMIPTHFISLTAMPLSTNNKVDVKLLKDMYQRVSLEDIQTLISMSADTVSASAHEQRIIRILAEFTGTDDSKISRRSSIFELGLDSISVISFSRCLKDAGFASAQPSVIMQNPTLSAMTLALQQSSESPAGLGMRLHHNAKQEIEAFAQRHMHHITERLKLKHSDIERISPCTPLQEGIIHQFLNSDQPLYCSSFSFRLGDDTDILKLRQAWLKTQEDVEMLRTRLSVTVDGYAQIVLKDSRLPWCHVEVADDEELDQTLTAKYSHWANNHDDVPDPLWEVCVIQSSNKAVMCLHMFHVLYDGNSLSLLLEKVARLYLGQPAGDRHVPSFFDVLASGPLCRDPSAESFWTSRLTFDRCGLVPKSNSPEHPSFVRKIQIEDTSHTDLIQRTLSVTEQAVLHACWLITLQSQFGKCPLLGIVVSGRALDVPQIDKVIGPLFNTLPSTIDMQDLNTWADLVNLCHEYHTATIPFQHTPLRDIMKWTGKSPEDPLFDSLFVFQRVNSRQDSLAETLWEPLDTRADPEYPLAFEAIRDLDGTLGIAIAAQDRVMSLDTADELLSKFERVLCELATAPFKTLPAGNSVLPSVDLQTKTRSQARNSALHAQADEFVWTAQASRIRDVIADLAGVDGSVVAGTTSIFELGLDSIDAIKLASRLRRQDIKITVSTIMRHRSIAGMVKHSSNAGHRKERPTDTTLSQLEMSLKQYLEDQGAKTPEFARILPATPLQEAMVAELIASDFKNYFNHDVLQLEPHVDVRKLEKSWQVVTESHPILRTSFLEIENSDIPVSYAQVVHKYNESDFAIADLGRTTVDVVIEKHRQHFISGKSHKRPLTILSLHSEGDKRFLVLSMAHSLYDGWSINLLHEDLAKTYAGKDCRRPSYDQILDHIVQSSREEASRFWKATLANAVPGLFPRNKRPGKHAARLHRRESTLSISKADCDLFCKKYGITMQTLTVTCWALVLAGLFKRLDVMFGLVLSGRDVADSEDVMFPTMNTVAMRAVLHGSRVEMIRHVQGMLVNISEHQHFPLRKVQSMLGSRQLFDTLFIYQKRPFEAGNETNSLYQSVGGSSAVEYPISVEVECVGEEFVCRVACRNDIVSSDETFQLLEQMNNVMLSIIQHPDFATIEYHANGAISICGCPVFHDQPNGKPNGTSSETMSTEAEGEGTALENQIRKALSHVSHVAEEKIGKETTLFHLGLDSISAIKVASRLKKQSIRLSVSDMLKARTVSAMARKAKIRSENVHSTERQEGVENLLDGIDTDALLGAYNIRSEDVETVLPATAGQVYFLSMSVLNPRTFYPKFSYMAATSLERGILDDAWTALQALLPVLRTVFLPTGRTEMPFLQAVMKAGQRFVIWHQHLTVDETWVEDDLRSGAVPATLHACQTPRGTLVMLHIHHALYDAVSLPRMVKTLARLCNSHKIESPINTSLSTFVDYERSRSPTYKRQQFWQQYLGTGSGATSGKTSVTFGALESYCRPGLVPNISEIETLAKQHSVSIQAIFLAAYARVHAQTIRDEDAISPTDHFSRNPEAVGLYLANRSHSLDGLDELIAPTVNIVPLRLDDKVNETCIFAAAKRIQNEIHEISRVEHCGVSLVEIAEWTGVRIDTCINFLKVPEMAESDDSENCDDSGQIQFRALSSEEVDDLHEQSSIDRTGKPESESASPASMKLPTNFQSIFQPTIDIETAVRNDQLDFGVFGPESRLGQTKAERIITAVREEMTRLVEGTVYLN